MVIPMIAKLAVLPRERRPMGHVRSFPREKRAVTPLAHATSSKFAMVCPQFVLRIPLSPPALYADKQLDRVTAPKGVTVYQALVPLIQNFPQAHSVVPRRAHVIPQKSATVCTMLAPPTTLPQQEPFVARH